MESFYWETLRARDALIAGDLPAAKRAADTLVHQNFEPIVPSEWVPWIRRIQQHASELTLAPNLGAATQELGQIAMKCGVCHDAHEDGPARRRTRPEPWRDSEALKDRMGRHQKGAEQMWEGLVTPSEDAFRSGAITLIRASFTAPDREGKATDSDLNARIEVIRELGKKAQSATTYEERGRVYGELIARCADCHYYSAPAD